MLFPQLGGKCQGKTRKDGARPALFLIFVLFYVFFVLFYVFFVLFYVFLFCTMYCLFCVVLSIVCEYMCTGLLPPGGYSIAVTYIISYIMSCHISYIKSYISYHIVSYHTISYKYHTMLSYCSVHLNTAIILPLCTCTYLQGLLPRSI
jgi:hypothetical protein